jgi:hypothetical protein
MGVITSKVKSNQAKQVEENVNSQNERLEDRNRIINVKPADITEVDDVKDVSNTDVKDVSNTDVKDVSNTDVNVSSDEPSNKILEHVEKNLEKEVSRCSKSLSLTTECSPRSTTETDGGDVCRDSTLSSSLLENPLLKRADESHLRRKDGELKPIGPLNPLKLGRSKDAIRLELAQTGLLGPTPRSDKSKNVFDTTDDCIIGEQNRIVVVPEKAIKESHADSTGDTCTDLHSKSRLPLDSGLPQKVRADKSPSQSANTRKKLSSNADKSPSQSANTRKKLSLNADVPKAYIAPASRPLPKGADRRPSVQHKATPVGESDELATSKLSREIERKIKMIDMDML